MLVWEDEHRSPQHPMPRPVNANDRDARPASPSLREVQTAPVLTHAIAVPAAAEAPAKA